MRISWLFLRRVAALALAAALIPVILLNAQREAMASHSPKRRSEIALRTAVSKDLTARGLSEYAQGIARRDPLHAVGFFLQAMALEKLDLISAGSYRELFAAAARRQPSFSAPRIWLVVEAIRNEQFDVAVSGADAVMRLNAEFRKLLVPIIVPLLADDNAYPILKRKLESYPIWRTEFIVAAINQGGYDNRIVQLLSANSPARYRTAMIAERSVYLQSLVAKGEASRAYALWQQLPPKPAVNAVFDGDFKQQQSILPFGWSFASDEYNYAKKVVISKGAAPLVRAYYNGDGRVIMMSQLIALSPGKKSITFEMRNGGMGAPETLSWQLSCNGVATPLATRSLAQLGEDWQKIRLAVDVPPENCALQSLQLVAANNFGSEFEVEIRKVEAE